MVADAELEMEGRKQEMMVKWEGNMARQKEADARTVKRIAEQKRSVEGQTALAARLANGPGGADRRQIGYNYHGGAGLEVTSWNKGVIDLDVEV